MKYTTNEERTLIRYLWSGGGTTGKIYEQKKTVQYEDNRARDMEGNININNIINNEHIS
jgi:hypothetical protein